MHNRHKNSIGLDYSYIKEFLLSVVDHTSSWKPYIAIGLILPSFVLAVLFIAKDLDIWSIFLAVVLLYCFFPVVMMGVYMWVTGNGHRWINGPDWTKMSKTTIVQGTRVVGLAMAVAMAAIMLGVSILFAEIGKNTTIGVLAMIIGTVACIAITAYSVATVSKKSFEEKWRIQSPKAPSRNSVIIVTGLLALSMVPIGYAVSEMGTDGTINITINDEDFTVTGPMFDHTFVYSEVDLFYLDENFEKGKRKMGYGTSTIKSGKFQNSQFGDYELASYAKIIPCVVIMVDSEYYAFNQSSDDLTHALYQKLQEKISV